MSAQKDRSEHAPRPCRQQSPGKPGKKKDWKHEMEKCKASPYYFATNYILIQTEDGPKPFNTMLTEEEYNKYFTQFVGRRYTRFRK